MIRTNKIMEIEKDKTRAGHREQGMVKNLQEIVEVGKASLYTHKYSVHFSLIVECPSMA